MAKLCVSSTLKLVASLTDPFVHASVHHHRRHHHQPISFTLHGNGILCGFWVEEEESWSTRGCAVGSRTLGRAQHLSAKLFKCTNIDVLDVGGLIGKHMSLALSRVMSTYGPRRDFEAWLVRLSSSTMRSSDFS